MINRIERWLMPFWVKTPPFARRLYPDVYWQIPDEEHSLYLTFDDGPTPNVTDWVLEQLAAFNAKATFFCLGRQAAAHYALMEQTLAQGHSVGNHSYSHLRGWNTPLAAYIQDIAQCAKLVPSALFRPPYGAITPAQVRYLLQNPQVCKLDKPPHIIMWSAISADWKRELTWQQCYQNVIRNVVTTHNKFSPIIVFHDSEKAFPNLKEVLPRILEHYAKQGFAFKAIQPNVMKPVL